jgi:hypothetical protein
LPDDVGDGIEHRSVEGERAHVDGVACDAAGGEQPGVAVGVDIAAIRR